MNRSFFHHCDLPKSHIFVARAVERGAQHQFLWRLIMCARGAGHVYHGQQIGHFVIGQRAGIPIIAKRKIFEASHFRLDPVCNLIRGIRDALRVTRARVSGDCAKRQQRRQNCDRFETHVMCPFRLNWRHNDRFSKKTAMVRGAT